MFGRWFHRVDLSTGDAEARHPSSRAERTMGRVLLEECHAYLTGKLLDQLVTRSEEIPVWTWTNLLAHGSLPDLEAELWKSASWPDAPREWSTARSDAVRTVVELIHSGQSLDELQRQVLIPLELELANRSDVASWSPDRWKETVMTRIAVSKRAHPTEEGRGPQGP